MRARNERSVDCRLDDGTLFVSGGTTNGGDANRQIRDASHLALATLPRIIYPRLTFDTNDKDEMIP